MSLIDDLGGYTLRGTYNDLVQRVQNWNWGRGTAKAEKGKLADTRRPKYTTGSVIPMVKQTTFVLPPFPISYRDMYNLSDLQPVLRTCKKAIRDETFRNGAKWIPRYSAKCDACNIEYEKRHPSENCPQCGGLLHPPDPNEYAEADKFFECCNFNQQSLIDISRSTDEDISVTDMGYYICRYEYTTDLDGNITDRKLKEIVRGSPILMRLILDQKGIPGGLHYVCPVHRDMVFHIKTKDSELTEDDEWIETYEGQRCPKCNRKLYDVHYVSLRNEGGDIQEYFIEGEVIRYSVYSANTVAYATPPMITLWVPASFLLYQEVYLRDAYERRRSPNRVITIRTANPDSFLNMWDKIMEKVKRDQWYTPVLPMETDPGGYNSGDINVVDLLPVVREMEYIASRDEARQRICAFYGVSNVFMADMRTVGAGATNEGLQILVTNRTVQTRQYIYNKDVFPRIVRDIFGIKDWYYVLKPNEERDVLKELQEEQMKVQIAQQMMMLGFDVDRSPDGDFIFQKLVQQNPLQTDPQNPNTNADMQTFTPNASQQFFQGQPELPTYKSDTESPYSKISSPLNAEGKWLKLSDFFKGNSYSGIPHLTPHGSMFKQLQSIPSKIKPVGQARDIRVDSAPDKKSGKLTPAQMPPKAVPIIKPPRPHNAPGFNPNAAKQNNIATENPELRNILIQVLQYLQDIRTDMNTVNNL